MFIVIIISLMLSGVLIGYMSRKRKINYIHRIITVLIWLLLFLLGIEVGNNKAIVNGLHAIGVEAFIITLAAVAGSILASWMLWAFIIRKKKGAGQ